MLKPIQKEDISIRQFKVYKEWTLDENDIKPIFGISGSGVFDDGDRFEKGGDFGGGGFGGGGAGGDW